MTVTSILLNFRDALLAVVPMAERVGIAWKRPDAYDQWDDIATALFQSLVVEVLRCSLPVGEQEAFTIPSYDLLLPTYAKHGTLEVVHPSLRAGRWLFHAFGTEAEPFDVVELLPLSEEGLVLSEGLETCSLEGAVFHLRLQGEQQLIEHVEAP